MGGTTRLATICSVHYRLPVQYILGEWDFHSITLKMQPPIFIPRPETENLVDIVLSHLKRTPKSSTVLDIGCGTGAICLALANAAQVCEQGCNLIFCLH